MKVSQLGEFRLIRRLSRLSPTSRRVVVGIGDDAAAVLPSQKKHLLLLTCDPVIEGVHFDSSATPYQIGWKAMARNISDIAAMGGRPLYALIAASLPRHTPVSKALGIHRGMAAAARRYGVAIVGGDTSHTSNGIHLTVTLAGEAARSELVTRSGARAGHVVAVTGTLGGSIFGKHLRFEPRLQEAQFLAGRFRPTAMMDISDGLASDLYRLSEQSRVGFEIWEKALPISRLLRSRRNSPGKRTEHALKDGEDYELLFTIPPDRFHSLQKQWKKLFRIPLTQIGIVRPPKFGVQLLQSNGKCAPILPANDHFRR